MARGKSTSLKAFEKLITVLMSGNPVTKEEIETTLGNEIQMYRLSTYIWDIKTHANGVIKVNKDGRKIVSYQLMNVDEMKSYMKRTGANTKPSAPVAKVAKPKVQKLKDLQAQPAAAADAETDSVTEITDTETSV